MKTQHIAAATLAVTAAFATVAGEAAIARSAAADSNMNHVTVVGKRMTAEEKALFDLQAQSDDAAAAPRVVVIGKRMTAEEKAQFDAMNRV